MGPAKQILGMHIVRDRTKKLLWLSQEKYVTKVRFSMESAKPVGRHCRQTAREVKNNVRDKKPRRPRWQKLLIPWQSKVWCMQWFARGRTLNMQSELSADIWATPEESIGRMSSGYYGTWKAPRACLRFGSGKPLLEGFTNSDMSADLDTSWSTSKYVMTYAMGAISWQSKLQKSVALSTMEAEYMEVVEDGMEVILIKDFIGGVGIRQE